MLINLKYLRLSLNSWCTHAMQWMRYDSVKCYFSHCFVKGDPFSSWAFSSDNNFLIGATTGGFLISWSLATWENIVASKFYEDGVC